jgi:hypothetical protein
MQLLRECLVGLLVVLTALSSSTYAQTRHVVRPAAIAAAVEEHAAKQNADRAAIHEALARPEVRNMATRIGIDLDRVTASVDTLSGPDLYGAASVARQVNETLVGGNSVTLSTTTIIIVLLALILIIVAVK